MAGSLSDECGAPDDAGSYSDHRSAYHTLKMISIISTLITGGVLMLLKLVHAFNYRYPREQRQVVRIFLAPTIFALISLWEVLDYRIAQYIEPIAAFYEMIFLCAIFLLFLQYAAPGGSFGDEMFQVVHATDESGQPVTFDWPRVTWIFVFQAPVFGLVILALTDITEATNTFCSGSFSPKHGNLWATILETFSLTLAITGLWKFYQHIKNRVNSRRGLPKILCFKAMVFLRWIQSLVFGILLDHEWVKPSHTFSYADLLYGLPNTINCVEMVIFAFLFWWVCNPREYLVKTPNRPPRKSPIYAFLDSFNLWDIIAGVARIFTVHMYLQSTGGWSAWNEARKAAGAAKKNKKNAKNNGGKVYDPLDSDSMALNSNANMGPQQPYSAPLPGYETSYRPGDGYEYAGAGVDGQNMNGERLPLYPEDLHHDARQHV